jgi:hypothetical protein
MRITVQAGLPVHWHGETIEYNLMRCIMDPLLILNKQDQLKSQVLDRQGKGNIRYDIRNSDIWITRISGAVTSVYVPISEFWNCDIRYKIWNPEIRITPISQLTAVISVYPDITAGELRYQRYCDIRETPISQYFQYQWYSYIIKPDIIVSDIGNTPISQQLRYHSSEKWALVSGVTSGYTDITAPSCDIGVWQESRWLVLVLLQE